MKKPRSSEPTKAGFVTFKNVEIATEALEALNDTQTPDGEIIKLVYARSKKLRVESSAKPNDKLYFSGSGVESDVRQVFDRFSAFISEVIICMLSSLSNSVSTTHLE